MKSYNAIITMNGKQYRISTHNGLGGCCRCITTDRLITSDATWKKILKVWAEEAHAEALEIEEALSNEEVLAASVPVNAVVWVEGLDVLWRSRDVINLDIGDMLAFLNIEGDVQYFHAITSCSVIGETNTHATFIKMHEEAVSDNNEEKT